jgi:hypothetical protein
LLFAFKLPEPTTVNLKPGSGGRRVGGSPEPEQRKKEPKKEEINIKH